MSEATWERRRDDISGVPRFHVAGFSTPVVCDWNADGKIDESFVVPEEREDLLVFGPDNPRPADAVEPNTPLP